MDIQYHGPNREKGQQVVEELTKAASREVAKFETNIHFQIYTPLILKTTLTEKYRSQELLHNLYEETKKHFLHLYKPLEEFSTYALDDVDLMLCSKEEQELLKQEVKNEYDKKVRFRKRLEDFVKMQFVKLASIFKKEPLHYKGAIVKDLSVEEMYLHTIKQHSAEEFTKDQLSFYEHTPLLEKIALEKGNPEPKDLFTSPVEIIENDSKEMILFNLEQVVDKIYNQNDSSVLRYESIDFK